MDDMKLVKIVNGDYVNLENVDSLFVYPKQGSWFVAARIGNQTFDLEEFQHNYRVTEAVQMGGKFVSWKTDAQFKLPSVPLEEQAKARMDAIAEELGAHNSPVEIRSVSKPVSRTKEEFESLRAELNISYAEDPDMKDVKKAPVKRAVRGRKGGVNAATS